MLESLEERTVPSLIASQFLQTTVSVPLVVDTFNATANQIVTLTANIGLIPGTFTGGTVNFTVISTLTGAVLGTVNNVPVINGVAQTPFTVPAGTPPGTFTISAIFSGNGSSGGSTLTVGLPAMTNCDSPAADAFLGTAARFAVLAGSTVTNTGPTTIIGDVGVSPGTAVTGFPPGSIAVGKPGSGGTIHSADAIAIQARNDVITAFNNLAGEPTTSNLTGLDLGGLTLTPGVYRFNSSAQLTGTLTLDAGGNPNARFDFQIGSTLTTASSSVVRVINGGFEDNVFWQVGSSATLGTTTEFEGNILALTSITLTTRASIACGRALAINGAVTMDTNFIDPPAISQSSVPLVDVRTGDFTGNGTSNVVGLDPQTGQWLVSMHNGLASVWATWSTAVQWTNVQVGDFNGDGKSDIIGRDPTTGQWWVGLSTGSSFTTSAWGAWSTAVTWVDVHVGDFAGNGKADIAGRVLQTGQWWVAQSTGSSFTNSLWATWSTGVSWVDVQVADINGDHMADITGRALQTGQWWTGISTGLGFATSLWATWNPNVNWVNVQVGDFNGDGLADIAGRVLQTGQWWVGQSTGSGFAATLWTTWNPNVTWVDVKVGDFNGDGKADIIGRVLQTGQWWLGQSTGSAFSNSLWATWSTAVSWVDVQVADLNGNGKADISGRASQDGSWWTGMSTGSSFNTVLGIA
jgi:hypothetical protein